MKKNMEDKHRQVLSQIRESVRHASCAAERCPCCQEYVGTIMRKKSSRQEILQVLLQLGLSQVQVQVRITSVEILFKITNTLINTYQRFTARYIKAHRTAHFSFTHQGSIVCDLIKKHHVITIFVSTLLSSLQFSLQSCSRWRSV